MAPLPPPPRIDFLAIVLLAGVVQGLLLSVAFVRQQGLGNRPQVWFAVMLVSLSLLMFDTWLGYTRLMFQVLWLVDFSEPFTFVVYPAAYLFVVSRTSMPRRWGWHLALAGVYAVSVLPFYFESSDVKYNAFVASLPELGLAPVPDGGYQFPYDWLVLKHRIRELITLQATAYTFLTWRWWWQHRPHGRQDWLPLLVQGMLTLNLVIWLGIRVLYADKDTGDYWSTLLSAIVLLGLGLILIQPVVLHQSAPVAPAEAGPRYARSGRTDVDIQQLAHTLQTRVQAEQMSRDPLLSRERLADALGWTPHLLTEVLNRGLGLSFYDFLAQQRVQDAQALLQDPNHRHRTLDDIAEAVGFSAKSSFHTAFRKITGQTPGEYRRSTSI